MPQKRLQRGELVCRPIDAMVDLGHPRVDRSDGGQVAYVMTACTDVLDPHARQAKDDLGLRRAAKQPVGTRILRGRVAAHCEAERRGGEGLALMLDRLARAPPPGPMDKGSVRGVHQPDDGVVDRCSKANSLDEIGWFFIEPVE